MHVVSFIIRIYHDARSPECQIQDGVKSVKEWTLWKCGIPQNCCGSCFGGKHKHISIRFSNSKINIC